MRDVRDTSEADVELARELRQLLDVHREELILGQDDLLLAVGSDDVSSFYSSPPLSFP